MNREVKTRRMRRNQTGELVDVWYFQYQASDRVTYSAGHTGSTGTVIAAPDHEGIMVVLWDDHPHVRQVAAYNVRPAELVITEDPI